MTKLTIRKKFEQRSKNKATETQTFIAESSKVIEQKTNSFEPKPECKATAEIVDSLTGGNYKVKAKVGILLNSKKSVSKKCSDKEVKNTNTKSATKKIDDAKVAKVAKVAQVCIPTIFIQDNLLRASLFADLNALHLDTTNNDNSIDFDATTCSKFFKNKINFYVEASENPMPDILEEVGSGCFVKRFLPKGHYPILQALFITKKGKAVYEFAITYPKIVKIVERGLSKLSSVSGNLTLPQAEQLGLKLIKGEHFSHYARK